MTTTQPAAPRWVLAVLTALTVIAALLLAAGTASAATAPAAENRIRASASAARTLDRPPQSVSQDQRLGNGLPEPGFVVATGVAANTASRSADDLIEGAATACARPNSFDAGTLVLMADGSRKPIEDVELGDEVIASDPETGEQGPRKVIDLIRHSGLHTMVDVGFSDGSQVDATDEHPFWVASTGEWVDAIDLHAGDVVISADGATVSVTSATVSRADLTAYNLTIAGLHIYHVGTDEVLVHNAGCDEWAAAFVKRAGGTSDEIKTFESPLGRQNGFLGPYRPGGPGTKAVDESWGHHTVGVRGGQVYDQWHPSGVGVDDFKQMFDYNDIIEFGF